MIFEDYRKHTNSIKHLYETAFPACERKPFTIIERNSKKGKAEILAICKDGFAGLIISIFYKDIVLIDYFAVDEKKRGYGIGSQALSLIKERYKGKRIFLEIERPDEKSENNCQRISRRKFYLRNNLKSSGIYVNLYKTEMELLIFSEPINYEEYVQLYEHAMGKLWVHILLRPKKIN
ncbi:hypothetical protein IMSAG049_00528 [Clostridiales bacterium]|nr:hypothetical protein IMSAG049_00528 [Clostridiales bacterium]